MSMYEGLWSASQHGGAPGSVAGGASTLLTAPAYLWHLYVEYLWNYERHPWILSASATFKLLALITIMPFVILSLLVSFISALHCAMLVLFPGDGIHGRLRLTYS